MAFGRKTNILYLITKYLLPYWRRLALFNSSTLNLVMIWWLMKGCMGQRFCKAVVWIAELVREKKLEIS